MATSTSPLWRWPATRVAHAIATAQVSAREGVESCLARIDETNPGLNALVEVRPDEALRAAAEADRTTASGVALGPLHGVPVSIKLNSDQAGHATTHGLVAFKDNMATTDSPQVAGLRRSGAIPLGRSNAPALAMRWFTTNALHGRTLNPWDASRTPGGSSGGAAAALACGMVPLGHGNDIAGSIRYPAYACGLVGLRPTVGRVAGDHGPAFPDPALHVQAMLVQGPLARSVADVRLMLAGMARADPRDPFSVPGAPEPPPLDRPLRVALVRDVGVAAPVPAVDAALDRAAGWLADVGCAVEEVELPLLAEAHRLWYLMAMEGSRPAAPLLAGLGDDDVRRAAEAYYDVSSQWWGSAPTFEDFLGGYARRGTLMGLLGEFLQRHPIVLLPVSAEQAFEQDADLAGTGGMRRVTAALWPMTSIAVLGFPAVAVPTGVAGGLPAGVQLLGRRFDEDRLLDAAEVIEARAGTFTPIDPR
ncbi:MAG: amidase [Blastococcus sp.]